MKQTKEISGIYDIATIECDCGCGILKFETENWDGQEIININYFPLGFYAHQKNWRTKLENIWKILTGKEYSLFDIILDKPDIIENFKNNLREYLEKDKNKKN